MVVLFSEVDIYDKFRDTKYDPHLFQRITWLGTRRQVIFHNSTISQQAALTYWPLRDGEVVLQLYLFKLIWRIDILSTSYKTELTLSQEHD